MLFTNKYGIDLGSSSVKIYSYFRNKSYIEKNMVAYKKRRILAVGNEAYEMFEKEPADISVNSPMAFGMIANLELQEIVLYSMLRRIEHGAGLGAVMYFAVPLDMTAIEKRAYYHLVNGHWLRKNRVFMVESPIADAIAMGVDLEKEEGSMIVNIGAQSTEISIITGGRIIISRKIPLGGRQMNEAICTEIRKRYNLQIGTRTAKRLKLVMGRLNDQKKEARKVVGIDSISGLPREEVISSYVVNAGIMNCVNQIASEMKTFLERTPPQIAYHIAKEGIYLTGGSTRLPYIDNYLASYTGFSFNLSELYETSAVCGLEKIIRDRELRKWAQPVRQKKMYRSMLDEEHQKKSTFSCQYKEQTSSGSYDDFLRKLYCHHICFGSCFHTFSGGSRFCCGSFSERHFLCEQYVWRYQEQYA